jgi:predicted aminopeptidase
VRIVILLILPLFFAGCRLGYVLQAANGQYEILSGSVPLSEGLQSASLSPDERQRLGLVPRIKEFGEDSLGLSETRNYQSVYLKSDNPPIYTVSASPRDRLSRMTWWFPVVGNMPYLGFFELEKAKAEGKKLRGKDLDVIIGRAEAYSTLGWFKDPVTLNLIRGSTLELVETIIHEMTHTTLYVKGQGEFNEGLALFIGKMGALAFMEGNYGKAHPLSLEAEKSIEDERIFCPYLNSLLNELEALYGSSLSYSDKLIEREKIFVQSLKQFRQLEQEFQTGEFRHFGSRNLNNAYLMAIALYHRHFTLFEAVFRANDRDIKKTMLFLKGLTEAHDDPLGQMQIWLKQKGTGTS